MKHACNPSTRRQEQRNLAVQGLSELQNEIKVSPDKEEEKKVGKEEEGGRGGGRGKSVFSAGDSRNTEVSTMLNNRNRGEKTKETSDQHWKFPGGEA